MVRNPKKKPRSASETAEVALATKVPLRGSSKTSAALALLKSKHGATIPELMEVTGWQSHSVRCFLAGALRTRHGLEPVSEKQDGELRRYRAR